MLVSAHFIKCRVTYTMTSDWGWHSDRRRTLTVSQKTHCVNIIFLHFPTTGFRKKKFLKVGLSHLKALHWASCGNWNTAWRTTIKCQVGEHESWWIIGNSSSQRVSSYLLCPRHLSPSSSSSFHPAHVLTAAVTRLKPWNPSSHFTAPLALSDQW